MIPANSVMIRNITDPMMLPDRLKQTGFTDRELGGVAIGDSSQGNNGFEWVLNYVSPDFMLNRVGEVAVSIFSAPNAVDVAFTFDQNMRPVLAWVTDSGALFLRYFDGVTNNPIVVPMGTGSSPRLTLDDKRPVLINNSDVIFAYLTATHLVYRVQRENYAIVHTIAPVDTGVYELRALGMGGNRLQFELSGRLI